MLTDKKSADGKTGWRDVGTQKYVLERVFRMFMVLTNKGFFKLGI